MTIRNELLVSGPAAAMEAFRRETTLAPMAGTSARRSNLRSYLSGAERYYKEQIQPDAVVLAEIEVGALSCNPARLRWHNEEDQQEARVLATRLRANPQVRKQAQKLIPDYAAYGTVRPAEVASLRFGDHKLSRERVDDRGDAIAFTFESERHIPEGLYRRLENAHPDCYFRATARFDSGRTQRFTFGCPPD